MLADKIRVLKSLSTLLFACGAILMAGCKPSGPKSLIQAQGWIQKGEYEKALLALNRAAVEIPQHPQVWNHYGLAYAGLRQPEKAIQAYQQALKLDRNFAQAHYNLGVLLLDYNRLPEGINEVAAFTVMQPENAAGWKLLGSALLKAKRPDDAERALSRALKLEPANPEIINNLGLVHLQRKRPREAVQAFNAALQAQPRYAPALLNQAIVAQQYFANKQAALERYKAYLAVSPASIERDEVQAIVNQLEQELNPPPSQPVVAAAQPRTNTPSVPSQPAAVEHTNKAVVQVEIPRTNAVAEAAPVPEPTHSQPTPVRTNTAVAVKPPVQAPPKTNSVTPPVQGSSSNMVAAATPPAGSRTAAPVVKTNSPAPVVEPPPEPEIPVEVVTVDLEPKFKPPVDAATQREQKVAATAPQQSNNPAQEEKPLFAPRKKEEEKPGLIARANPLNWFKHNEKPERPLPPPARVPNYTPANQNIAPAPPVEPKPVPRYPYRKNLSTQPGNRTEAAKLFNAGALAQGKKQLPTAIESYKNAIALDPSYFEAYYNLGVAAYQNKDLPLALAADEHAVALKPASVDARYNFALALRDANYHTDAANELRELLVESPDEPRAHFALANIYSQFLNQPLLAKRHYKRLLELNPNHPQAAIIREWLVANP